MFWTDGVKNYREELLFYELLTRENCENAMEDCSTPASGPSPLATTTQGAQNSSKIVDLDSD